MPNDPINEDLVLAEIKKLQEAAFFGIPTSGIGALPTEEEPPLTEEELRAWRQAVAREQALRQSAG
jgi:hypothetical protein